MNRIKDSGLKAIKWLEGYTKTDTMYIARGGFWLGIGQIVSSGSVLLTSIAFANLLSPETFGIYRYILSINSLLLITTLSGIDSAVTQAVARGFDGTLNSAIKTKIKWGTLGSLISLAIATYYYLQGNTTLAISFSITAMFSPVAESFDIYNALLWGKKLFGTQTFYNICKKVVILISIITTILLTKNIYVILLVYFLSIAIPNLIIFLRVRRKYKENNEIEPGTISYGKHLSLINLFNTVLNELDKILVFQNVGAVDLAIYSMATAPNDQIKGLLKNVNALAMPQFSQKTSSEIKKTLWRKVWILGIITGLIVLCYILISPLFFKIFFPKYLSSVRFSQILSLSLIPVVISGFLNTVLESQKAKTELYKYNTYSNIFNLVTLLSLIFYFGFGIWGAVIAKSLRRVFEFTLSTMLVKKIN